MQKETQLENQSMPVRESRLEPTAHSLSPITHSFSLPANFPIMNKTGNVEKDKVAYETQKMEWLENNLEKYDRMSTDEKRYWFGEYNTKIEAHISAAKQKYYASTVSPRSENTNLQSSVKEEISPEYKEKLLWILEHEAEYRRMMNKEEADKNIQFAKQMISANEVKVNLVYENDFNPDIYSEEDKAKYLWILNNEEEYRKNMKKEDADAIISIANKLHKK